ncbi:hypothetical protein CO046_02170 [Candidatus Peregrinibacteria bacterium CG_4_9_14_0_2_um_filter_53_11]|nr:MAG: hypothetical protein CO046_02170 [Candidatus Peregrinibacteria bacterium CG_4_9_14_0_2_um_filter_53_11]
MKLTHDTILPFAVGVLLSGLVFSVPVASAENFSDVPANHPHAAAIEALKDAELVTGYNDGTFKPDQAINRAEATAMVLKAAGIPLQSSTQKLPFSDVVETDWFYPMIQRGVALNKLKGYPDQTFRPGLPVTLPEALALSLSFQNISTTSTNVESTIYKGLDPAEWYGKTAQYAKNNYIIEPNPDGTLDPTASISRGQLAEIVFRTRQVKNSGRAFDITTEWTTSEHNLNYWSFRHPANWQLFKGQTNSGLWYQEPSAFISRLWPRGVRLSVSLSENTGGLTANGYFNEVKASYAREYPGLAVSSSSLTLGQRPALRVVVPQRHLIDTYVQLPNGMYLIIYGEYGEAPIAEFYKKQLELVLGSYKYVEAPATPPLPPLEERMAQLREKILVEGAWEQLMSYFPDKRLIHTDGIGVGTGPVDYFFSAEAATTIKVERESNTILNIRDGETSAF